MARAAVIALILAALPAALTAADRAFVFVSAAGDAKLYAYDLDLTSGALEPRGRIELEGAPGPQCLDPKLERLYVSVRSAKTVAAFNLDRSTGALQLIKSTPVGVNSTYVATDKTGKWLLSASYSDGKVSTYRINDDGSVGENVSMIDTVRCAHAILTDAANRFAFVPHTCPNAVYQFRFDAATGRLSANDPATVQPADGLQPRHLAFHPKLDVVYFDDEVGSSVTAYHYNRAKGQLAPFQTVSTLPEDWSPRNTCADIEITSDGRFVYASNRGHDSIAAFEVDLKTGELKRAGRFSTGQTPRSFNLSPDGNWLVAAGQKSNDLTTYRRDAKTGALAQLKVYPTGKNPSWVQIVEKADAISAPTGDNWPRFRGPNGNAAVADDPRLPERWSTTENVAWKVDVPGWAWSSPIVFEDKVFVSTVVSDGDYEKPKKGLYNGRGRKEIPKGDHRWLVYAFDVASGKQLWEREARHGPVKTGRHPKSTFASETPCTDGERLYVLFGDVGLYCYDLDGKPLWSKEITPRETFWNYGAAASPIVHDGQVIMVYDNQEESFVASFDAKTGQQIWRTPRAEKSTWATPYLWQNDVRSEIVVCGRTKNRSYDLSGKLLWEFDGRMSGLVIPSPFAVDGMLYITSGYFQDRHRPVFAVKPGATGDFTPDRMKDPEKRGATTNDFVSWYLPLAGPYNTSPLVYRGRYFTVYDRGFLSCYDAKTGAEIYGKRRLPPGSSFTSSPWAYNGRLFCLTEDGDTLVLDAGSSDLNVLHSNSLDELCMATPAIAQGRLFIRTATKLYCIARSE